MIEPGAEVEHPDYGPGRVVAVLGRTVTANFFGEVLDVDLGELKVQNDKGPIGPVVDPPPTTAIAFRKIFEALNLGVVPGDPEELLRMTIGGGAIGKEVRVALQTAPATGATRVFLGYYGSGKTHHLQVVRAVALTQGWATAWLELDPKAADPAKPSTVYGAIVGGLQFPMRDDGSRCIDFFDLVKEIRDNWGAIRRLPYFQKSPWFRLGIEALMSAAHRRNDPDYAAAVAWLGGQMGQVGAIRALGRQAQIRRQIPTMPQTKDTGTLYAFQLVVLNEVLKALGYKGLALIIDEAEHVRSYSINRYARARNFFDVLARCAHPPRDELPDPASDYEDLDLPPFWRKGPHFSLFVGLTEGDGGSADAPRLGEMSVLVHDPREVVRLAPPDAADYEEWCRSFLSECGDRLGPRVEPLRCKRVVGKLAKALRGHFEATSDEDRVLRNWVKIAGLAPAILMSRAEEISEEELVEIVGRSALELAGEVLPWDE